MADKSLYGVYRGEEIVGCVEVIRGFPTEEVAMIGLLLIHQTSQGQGLGRLAYEATEEVCRSWPSTRRLRIGVILSNDIVLAFWKKMGFIRTGEEFAYTHAAVRSTIIALEKEIP